MTASVDLTSARDALFELAPVLRRAVALDPRSLARIRIAGGTAAAFVRLPFDVLVARTIQCDPELAAIDVTVRASDVLAWLDCESNGRSDFESNGAANNRSALQSNDELEQHDVQWRTGLPPSAGWRRVDTVPDDVVRRLVRSGATVLKDAADLEGVPGARPRAEVADALLDSVVLTVTAEGQPPAQITLRVLSALTRMGFLPRDSHIAIDVAGRWTRVAAEFGSVYLERTGLTLNLS